jgi:hypothetical protein
VVEKYLRVVPKKYTQITLSMETLLNLSTLSIEEVTGQLKAMDNREEAPPANPVSNPVSTDSKLLFTEEQWFARQKEKKREGSSSSKDCRRKPHKKSSDGGINSGKGGGGGGGECKVTHDDTYLNCGPHDH